MCEREWRGSRKRGKELTIRFSCSGVSWLFGAPPAGGGGVEGRVFSMIGASNLFRQVVGANAAGREELQRMKTRQALGDLIDKVSHSALAGIGVAQSSWATWYPPTSEAP
jgi:hypothetical protein